MTQAYAILLESVQSVRQRWRVRRVLEGLLLAAAVAVGGLTLATMFDHALALPKPGRLVLLLAVLAGVGYVLLRGIAAPLWQRRSDDFFAALLEQRCPALGNRLINALQLGRDPQPRSPRLVEAIVEDGYQAMEGLDTAPAVRSETLRQRMIALGVVLAVALGYFLLAAAPAATALRRVLLPLADIAPFTWTQVELAGVEVDGRRHELRPGQPLTVLEGSAVTVEARTTGRPVDAVHLAWTDAQDRPRRVPMNPPSATAAAANPGSARYRYTFAGLEAGMAFRLLAGDGQSPRYQLAVEPRPRVQKLAVAYQPPAYTGLPAAPAAEFDGHLRGLPGTAAALTVTANKDLRSLTLRSDTLPPLAFQPSGGTGDTGGTRTWTARLTLTQTAAYRFRLVDLAGHEVDDPARYTLTVERDSPPAVAIALPGRDLEVQPQDAIAFRLVAHDDYGLGEITLLGQTADQAEPTVLRRWPGESSAGQASSVEQPASVVGQASVGQASRLPPPKRVEETFELTPADLGLTPGSRLVYWAAAADRNDLAEHGPGRAETRRYSLLVLSPEQARQQVELRLTLYARIIREELLPLQRLNHLETQAFKPAPELVDRQSLIRRRTQQLVQMMTDDGFPARTVIDTLSRLAAGEMAQVVTGLEAYGAQPDREAARALAGNTLPLQQRIIDELEAILQRLDRDEQARQRLKRMQQNEPAAHEQVTAALEKLAQDLDQFLLDQRELAEAYEKLPKRDVEEFDDEDLAALQDAEHRLDRWKQWSKDTVDALTKLPQGFARDTNLAEDVNTIFEEIEKKARPPTVEIATPVEEGAMEVGTEILEDLEIWMMDHGDNLKWVMEDPPGGMFEVPEATLPDNLQDMVGDLIEDLEEFDEDADDTTGAWGGNIPQVGWDIMDGPISSFSATGKTGNQLPNDSEITGRSGAGRRGKATGQMVGDRSAAMEGRPTPARVTNERYEEGQVDASKQLDPRGSTGGGKKTGAGIRGLQGGTPPDFQREMDRLTREHEYLKEQTQRLTEHLDRAGRSSTRVDRALELMQAAEADLRDLRYHDAARKRKMALGELQAEAHQIDQAVNLSMQRAQHLPAELRQEITAGARQALPQGYEDLVGAYYKALSEADTPPGANE